MAFTLAACAEMIFTELPFVERVMRIHDLGFQIEIWDWSSKDLPALAATGAAFSSMTGYLRGDLVDDDGVAELLSTARESLEAAKTINPPRLNLHGTGLDNRGLPVKPRTVVTDRDFSRARDTLSRLADLGAQYERIFMLENLNLIVDHPGTPFGLARDTIALVSTVNHPNMRLNLDLYHAQIGEGNLVELVRQAMPWIGEFQVADVPGRREPGTGEINYPRIARELADLDYTGVIGMEAFASGDSEVALEKFRDAFTPAS